jgi:hypothetical protein
MGHQTCRYRNFAKQMWRCLKVTCLFTLQMHTLKGGEVVDYWIKHWQACSPSEKESQSVEKIWLRKATLPKVRRWSHPNIINSYCLKDTYIHAYIYTTSYIHVLLYCITLYYIVLYYVILLYILCHIYTYIYILCCIILYIFYFIIFHYIVIYVVLLYHKS